MMKMTSSLTALMGLTLLLQLSCSGKDGDAQDSEATPPPVSDSAPADP